MIVGGSQTFSKGILNLKEKSEVWDEEAFNTATLEHLNTGLFTSNSRNTDLLGSDPSTATGALNTHVTTTKSKTILHQAYL